MYTAKVINKVFDQGLLTINVEFTDGKETFTDHCVPQDKDAFNGWLKQKLEFLNHAKKTYKDLKDGDPLVVVEIPTVTPTPVLTAEETARNTWLKDYERWVKVKSTLIDTGILTGNEAPLVNLKNKVKTNFLPNYINSI